MDDLSSRGSRGQGIWRQPTGWWPRARTSGASPVPPSAGEVVAGRALPVRSGFRQDVLSGWQVVFGRRDLGAFFILVSFLNLVFDAALVLIPVLGRDVRQAGPRGLGWLQAAMAAGAWWEAP